MARKAPQCVYKALWRVKATSFLTHPSSATAQSNLENYPSDGGVQNAHATRLLLLMVALSLQSTQRSFGFLRQASTRGTCRQALEDLSCFGRANLFQYLHRP